MKNLYEDFITEDELQSIYEKEIIDEDDIIRLEESLEILSDWNELLSEIEQTTTSRVRKLVKRYGAKALGYGLRRKKQYPRKLRLGKK